jgi:hypothetical protein
MIFKDIYPMFKVAGFSVKFVSALFDVIGLVFEGF